MRIAAIFVLVATLAAGCGDDGVDISGMYMATMESSDPDGCGPGAEPTPRTMFFQIKEDTFFGAKFYSLSKCTSQMVNSCTGGGLFAGAPLSESISDGWKGKISVSSGDSTSCSLQYGEATATLINGTLRYESKKFGVSAMSGISDCSTDEAEKRGKSMPCDGYGLIVGSKVPAL
ncbi:MAG: hypothetical protein IT370_18295 [Deltaproteobacteria bacterium]|nr:hypothetical protein [Deltaproteobacteria bacterium]